MNCRLRSSLAAIVAPEVSYAIHDAFPPLLNALQVTAMNAAAPIWVVTTGPDVEAMSP